RRRHTRCYRDWSSDVCSSDLWMTSRALALAGHEVLVLERAYTIGFETSSRNSEVIHGGLYYPAGSLKARCCVDGRQRLYAYCREIGRASCRGSGMITGWERYG